MSKRVERFEVGRRYRRIDGGDEFVAQRVGADGTRAWDHFWSNPWEIEQEWELASDEKAKTAPTLRVQSSSGFLTSYATPGASGLDLAAAVDVELPPHSRAVIPTGLSMEIPAGYEGQVRPRSGLTARTSLTVHLGTIDSDYRGEVGVIAENCGPAPYSITKGQRIAQLVIAPVARVEVVRVEQLGDTERGSGGFGSTGA